MGNTRMFQLPADFHMDLLVSHLCSIYQSKGYLVMPARSSTGVTIRIQKNNSGFYQAIGLVEGIRVYLSVVNHNMLLLSFSEEQWMDKVIALIIGFFCCNLTWISGGIGLYRQTSLPGDISNIVLMYLASFTNPQPPAN